jgi:hypothetical protein
MSEDARVAVFKALATKSSEVFDGGGVPALIPIMNDLLTTTEDSDTLFMMVCALLHSEGTEVPTVLFLSQFMNVFRGLNFEGYDGRKALLDEMISTAGSQLCMHLMGYAATTANKMAHVLGSTFQTQVLKTSIELKSNEEAPTTFH